MRSHREDQVKCGEQKCGQKLNLAGGENERKSKDDIKW
jgi:hypothetical protein